MRKLTWKRRARGWLAMLALCLAANLAKPQSQLEQQPKHVIPDAPSASRPPQLFPATPPRVQPSPPVSGEVTPQPERAPAPKELMEPPKPLLNIKTVPQRGATPELGIPQEALYEINSNVNQVMVPVMVKDDSGRLTSGLLLKDFSVYEDGLEQKMNFFTSDPFALSVAVIFDLGMSNSAVQKVKQTFPALEGAFSPVDEVSIYTYNSTFSRVSDFAAAGQQAMTKLDALKSVSGRNNGLPVTSGPLSSQGPVVNGVSVDVPVARVVTPPKRAHILNDALLAAALNLSKRDRTRRKILFIIGDGREFGSKASYGDVLKVLLTNSIIVYGIATEDAAIRGYKELARVHLPGFGYSNLLPKYSELTGGWLYTEFSLSAIEHAYSRALSDARNQYTLGYVTRSTSSTGYRDIEVKVDRPNCESSQRPCVSVYAKDGFYPAPPGR